MASTTPSDGELAPRRIKRGGGADLSVLHLDAGAPGRPNIVHT
jgi:hypothetical protein